jgi:hypothetical protein
MLTKN